MTKPESLHEQAARTLRRRTLDTLNARITDPVWRERAQQFASGRMSGEDVLAYIEQSPAAMRSFDRHLIKLTQLSDDELNALRERHDQHLDEIAHELAQQHGPAPRATQARPTNARISDDDRSWEDGTWMERA